MLLCPVMAEAQTLQVAADTSLKLVLQDLAGRFIEGRSVGVQINLAPSGILRKQVLTDDSLDIFIGAAPGEIEELSKLNKIQADTVKTLAENEIVIVSSWPLRKDQNTDWVSLIKGEWERVAVASSETCMSGVAALALLKAKKILDDVEDKLIYESDSDRVLDNLKRAQVAAAIVYRSDIRRLQPRATYHVFEADETSLPPIVYCGAVLKQSKFSAEAVRFLEFLKSAENSQTWADYGFSPVEGQDRIDGAKSKDEENTGAAHSSSQEKNHLAPNTEKDDKK